ncbi:hypothetical protein Hanom_Chr05g00426041 [Helianthus anomalus]
MHGNSKKVPEETVKFPMQEKLKDQGNNLFSFASPQKEAVMDNISVGPEVLEEGEIPTNFNMGETAEHVQEEMLREQVSSQKRIHDDREDVGHASGNFQAEEKDGPGPINTRPSYITCRPKRGKNPKKKAQYLIIPDLNQEPEITNTSDRFNLEEIFQLEEEVIRMREFVPSWSMRREASEEIVGEEQVCLNFEDEVSRTLEFGAYLGIGVDGFENHVKILVREEMEINRDQ